ncbi:MAG: porin [Woeseiaceae bacterium]|nr:porin [Woeseiaceae bacterium]
MFRKSLGILLLVAATPAVADISYNYVDLGFQRIELDVPGADVDGDGFAIGGSFKIAEDWFVQAGYGTADFDFGIDLDQTALGLGYRSAISPTSDVFATVSYVRAEVSASGFGSADDDGFGISVGVRAMLTDVLELNGSIGYVDFDDGGDGTSFSAGGLYNFTDTFALGLGIGVEEDVTSYGIFGRIYFGN